MSQTALAEMVVQIVKRSQRDDAERGGAVVAVGQRTGRGEASQGDVVAAAGECPRHLEVPAPQPADEVRVDRLVEDQDPHSPRRSRRGHYLHSCRAAISAERRLIEESSTPQVMQSTLAM